LDCRRIFPHREEIVDATFAIVLATLVLQGATIEPFLKRLPLAQRKRGAPDVSDAV
jgi:NhaP-type Na+/H+ or K+/H+ antiporter